MTQPFTKDDDPTEILQFSFLDPDGKVTKRSIKSAFTPPYPAKYYINTTLAIIGVTVFLLWNYGIIRGTKLGFFCNDPLFSHEYRGDTITPTMLGLGIPLIFPGLYFCIELIRQGSCKETFSWASFFELYVYMKQFTVGIILVGGVTEIAKTLVGEHRPHFFDTCMPDTNLNCTNGTYIFDFTCTNAKVSFLDYVDASRSFPSGHSSLSWFVAIFTSYIIHSRLPIHRTGTFFKIFMFTISITFALTSSLTRITDRRHHWWDVLVGTVLGIAGAFFVIRMTHVQVKVLRQKIMSEEKEEVQQIDCNV